jgi:putative CocE/NonD family hydrolase
VPWARLNGSVDGGPAADNSVDDLHIAWFDHWLKERPLEEAGGAVRYYEMGSNLWRSSSAWPPAGARTLELFLHSGGRANSLSGNGTLSDTPPADESPDIFVYDPAEPVPSIGGSSCCRPDVTPVGAFDQRSNEIRNDVLVYTTDILDRDTHVAGPVAVTLHAATDAPDTDWTAKLVDVHPDGRAINLCDGIVRARFRKGLDAPAPLDDGEVCAYTIDLAATANRFAAGHRIRLEISSSSFPAYDVNDNSGRGGCRAEPFAGRTATQVVFHDRARPSRLKLMVTDAPPPRS